MTKNEARLALKSLGWKWADLCRRLGLNKNTPGKWKDEVPGYVSEYLRVCLGVQEVIGAGGRQDAVASPPWADV